MRMFTTLICVLAAAGVPLCASAQAQSAAAAPAATAPQPEDAAVTKIARTELDAFLAGKIDRSHYVAGSQTQLTDAIVTRVSGLLAPGGKVMSFSYLGPGTLKGMAVLQYAVGFEHPIALPNGASSKDFVEDLIVDKTGKVALIFFTPKGM